MLPLLPPPSPQISQSQWRSVIQLTGKAPPLLRSSQRVKTQQSRPPISRSQKQRPVMDGVSTIVSVQHLTSAKTGPAALCIQTQKASEEMHPSSFPEMIMNPPHMKIDAKEMHDDTDTASE